MMVLSHRNRSDPYFHFTFLFGYTKPPFLQIGLLSAEKNGEEVLQKFVQERLAEAKVDFFGVLSRLKIATFKFVSKHLSVRVSGKEVIRRADRNLFTRLIVVAQMRSFDMRRVLSFPLGLLPLSLAKPDGSLVTTSKAKLLHHLEEMAAPCVYAQNRSTVAWIVDAMAMLQAITSSLSTFVKSAVQLLRQSGQHTVALSRLASNYELTPDVFAGCERFVAALCKHSAEVNIGIVRYCVFCSSSGQSSSPPPTQAALFKHCQRAAYEVAIWK